MRRFFVHVNGGGEYVVLADLAGEEVKRRLEKRLDLIPLLPLEKLRAGGDERIHEADAVLAGLASAASIRLLVSCKYDFMGFTIWKLYLLRSVLMSGLLAYFSLVRSR